MFVGGGEKDFERKCKVPNWTGFLDSLGDGFGQREKVPEIAGVWSFLEVVFLILTSKSESYGKSEVGEWRDSRVRPPNQWSDVLRVSEFMSRRQWRLARQVAEPKPPDSLVPISHDPTAAPGEGMREDGG